MKIVFHVLGALAILAILVVAVGFLVPRRHVSRRCARFARTPEEIYAAITGYADLPTWQPDLKRVEMLEPRGGKTRYRLHRRTGAMTLVVDEAIPPTRVRGRIEDEDLGFGGTWTYEIARIEGGATLIITEDGYISNPMFRTLARFVFGYHATMDAYLRALGKKFGEEVAPFGA